MSLDDAARRVWQTKTQPLAILVAGRATAMLASQLPAEERAPFDALSLALDGWWPNRARRPEDIYATEFRACLDALGAHESAGLRAAMSGAYVQMAALLKVVPRSLPADGFYSMGEEDFLKLLRDAAKVGRLPAAQLKARLELLLEWKRERWPKLVARADRMRWDRGEPWGKLDKRIRTLASLADLGASWSWSDVSGQKVLRLELDDTKRMAALKPEELAALRVVIPAIGEPD